MVFGDEDAPRKPPVQNGNNNNNNNNNVQPGQDTSARFPFPGFQLNGLQEVIPQLGNLVNQFLNPFVPGGQNNGQRPGNFNPDRNNNNGGCRTFQNGPGSCTRLPNCASLNRVLNSVPPFQANRILRRSICGFSGNGPLVCCPFEGGFGGNNNGGNFGGQGGNGQFGQGGNGQFGQGGNNFGGQGGNGQGGNNFGGTGPNQGGTGGNQGGNQGGNFGGTGGNPTGGFNNGNNGGLVTGGNNNGGLVPGGNNNGGGGFNNGGGFDKGEPAVPESPKPTPSTTSNPFTNNNGGPVTLAPPKPKPPTTGGGLVTGGNNNNNGGGGADPKNPYVVPGTNIPCGFSNATHPKIVGGKDAEIGRKPVIHY